MTPSSPGSTAEVVVAIVVAVVVAGEGARGVVEGEAPVVVSELASVDVGSAPESPDTTRAHDTIVIPIRTRKTIDLLRGDPSITGIMRGLEPEDPKCLSQDPEQHNDDD